MKNQRKFLALFIVCCLISTLIFIPQMVSAVEPNLITNGDFEDTEVGVTPTGFIFYNGLAIATSDYVNTGTKSLKVTASALQPAVNFNAPLESNTRYKITAYVKVDSSYTGDAQFILRVADYNNAYWAVKGAVKINNTAAFTAIETVVDMGTAAATSRINLYTDEAATYYVDSLSCVKIIPATELVTDGNFETFTVGATVTGSGAVGTYTVSNGTATVSNTAHNGTNSVFLQNTTTSDMGFNYYLPLTAGKTYVFSAWVKPDAASTAATTFYIRMSDTTFAFLDRGLAEKLPTTSGWVKIAAAYTSPNSYPKARLNIGLSGSGKGYIDEISCQVVDPVVTSTNKLVNGSFELPAPLPTSVTTGTSAITKDYAHRGLQSLKVQHDAANTANQLGVNFSPVTFEAGKTYRFGAWVKYDATALTTEDLRYYIRMLDGSTQLNILYSDKLIPGADFSYLSVIYTATVATSAVRLNLSMGAKSGAIGYIDDLTFEEVTSVAPIADNLISNSSYEDSTKNFLYDVATTKVDFADKYVPEYVNQGQYALKVEQLTSSGSVNYQMTVDPGATYKFGLSTRLDKSVTDTTRVYINTRLAGDTLKTTSDIKGTNIYQNVEKTFTVPYDVTQVTIQVKADTGVGSTNKKYTYYIDDVYLVKTCIEFADAKLYKNDDGDYVSSLYTDSGAGERLFTVSSIKNSTASPVTMSALVALYSGNQLINVGMDSKTIQVGATLSELNASINVPANIADFKLKTFIFDGVSLKPYIKPLKLLIIGNSITYHGAKPSEGWTGDWGMAASSREKDYVHVLTAKIKETVPYLRMDYINIAPIEGDYANVATLATQSPYKDKIAYNPDVIIITIGANIPSGITVEQYKNIVDAFNPTGKAKVIIGTTVLTSQEKLSVIQNYAQTYNKPIVAMHDLSDPKYFPVKSGFYADCSAGVLAHPGDLGMQEMADRLFPTLRSVLIDLGA